MEAWRVAILVLTAALEGTFGAPPHERATTRGVRESAQDEEAEGARRGVGREAAVPVEEHRNGTATVDQRPAADATAPPTAEVAGDAGDETVDEADDVAERAEIAEVMYRAALWPATRRRLAASRPPPRRRPRSPRGSRCCWGARRPSRTWSGSLRNAPRRQKPWSKRPRSALPQRRRWSRPSPGGRGGRGPGDGRAERDTIGNARDRNASNAIPSPTPGPGRGRARLGLVPTRGRDELAAEPDDEALDRARLEAELQRAHLDGLTGAFRREMGRLALRNEIDRARRADGKFVIAYIDVDGLKGVNDRNGHAAGDRVLRMLVATMRANLRSYDPIVRFGGDEFVCGIARSTPARSSTGSASSTSRCAT